MTTPRRVKRLVLLMLLLPVLMSCATVKTWISSNGAVKTDVASPSSAQAVDQARQLMAAGEYQKAIDAYHDACQRQQTDPALAGAYVKSVGKLAAEADVAFDKQDFGSAGKIYDVLLRNNQRFKGVDKMPAFNRPLLEEKLDDCKKSLFKQGVQEYRQGNLSEAIDLWQDLLVIDPQNTDIKEALRIARLQQKNLQEGE
jgi:tetratricopeptide (TPR) repeat protein